MRLQRTARIRAIRLPARRATIARILKVKISLGTPLRVYRESRSAAAPFARMKSGSDFSEIDFAKARRSEARRSKSRGSRTHASRRLRDTALKVVAGSRDPRENRTVSHVPGDVNGNRFRRSHLRSLRSSASLAFAQQRFLHRYYRMDIPYSIYPPSV